MIYSLKFLVIKGKKNCLTKSNRLFAIQTAWDQEALEKSSRHYTEKLLLEHSQVLQQNKEDGIKIIQRKSSYIKWRIIDNFVQTASPFELISVVAIMWKTG